MDFNVLRSAITERLQFLDRNALRVGADHRDIVCVAALEKIAKTIAEFAGLKAAGRE